jgi:hypothetical protein
MECVVSSDDKNNKNDSVGKVHVLGTHILVMLKRNRTWFGSNDIVGLFPGRCRDFHLHYHCVQTGSAGHQTSYTGVIRGLFP